MSPFRYTFVQLALVSLCGCCAALAVLSLPSLAVVLLLAAAALAYALVNHVSYHPDARDWRRRINMVLTRLILSHVGGAQTSSTVTKRPDLVHKETQKLIQMILKDFVTSWYYQISENQEFPQKTCELLEHLGVELQTRVQAVDVKETILSLLPLLDPYLTALNEVGFVNKRGKMTFDVNHPYCLMLFEKKPHLVHPALKSEQAEIEHLQRLFDSFVCSSAIPSHYKHCDIAVQFIREILVYRVFQPLVKLVCEPDFLLKAIPLILAKANDEKVRAIMEMIEEENKVLDGHLAQPTGLMTPYSIKPPLVPPTYPSFTESSLFNQSACYPRPSNNSRSLERDRAATVIALSACAPPPNEITEEDLVYVSLPPVYVDRYVRVNTSDGLHIGYIVKFPSKMIDQVDLDAQNIEEVGELESLKRYSEFVHLHKLLATSRWSGLVKDLLLPDRKIFANILNKIPFSSGEPDPATILERKEGLEKYLIGLSNIAEIRESFVFKEFLLSGVKVLRNANIVTNKPRRWLTREKRKHVSIKETTVESTQHSFSEILSMFSENNLPITPQYVPPAKPSSPTSSLTNKSPPSTASVAINWQELIWTAISSLFSQKTSSDSHIELAAERQETSPLINALLSLANEATRTTSPELWLTSEGTQLALLGLCGEALDTYMFKELEEVVTDETRWARSLFNLRHLLWPEGNLSVSPQVTLTDQERQTHRADTVKEIKNFLPSVLPLLVGAGTYDTTIEHCLNCIQNPTINRHFLYRAIDILFLQIVPEFKEKEFQKSLMKLRTKPRFVSSN